MTKLRKFTLLFSCKNSLHFEFVKVNQNNSENKISVRVLSLIKKKKEKTYININFVLAFEIHI